MQVGGEGKFNDIFFMQPDRSLNDEIQIIHSRSMAERVVQGLGLQTMYLAQGKVRSSVIYSKESPFLLDIEDLNDSTRGFNLQVNVLNDQTFTLGENPESLNFGQSFGTSAGRFRLL